MCSACVFCSRVFVAPVADNVMLWSRQNFSVSPYCSSGARSPCKCNGYPHRSEKDFNAVGTHSLRGMSMTTTLPDGMMTKTWKDHDCVQMLCTLAKAVSV